MYRLRRVQEEIEARQNLDRLEIEKIFRDLLESNKSFTNAVSGQGGSPYRNEPQKTTYYHSNGKVPIYSSLIPQSVTILDLRASSHRFNNKIWTQGDLKSLTHKQIVI